MYVQMAKDFLEIIYYISGPLLAFFAFKALAQIKETRKQANEARETRITNAKRSSYQLAAEKCDFYLNVIIPKINNLDAVIREQNITFFEKSQVEVSNTNIKVKPAFKDEGERNKVLLEIPCLEVFNPIESFSLFFVSGIADEKIAYLTVGTTFLGSVKRYLPLYVILSNGKHFNNTFKLFMIWHNRREKEILEKEKHAIEQKLNKNISLEVKNIGAE